MVYGLIGLAVLIGIVAVAGHAEREMYTIRWFDLASRSKEPLPPWNVALFQNRWRPLRSYVRETIYGILYVATMVVSTLFGWMGRGERKRWSDEGPLVVLVHGFKATSAHFWLMRWRLRRLGIRNILTFSYDGKDPDAPYHRRLRDRILTAQSDGASDRTIIIGHSFGGIIGFDYATQCADAGEMAGLVALGSPFHGSRMAALGLSAMARSLGPENPRFATLLTQSPGCPFLSLFTRYDQFVLPWTNSEHPAAENVEIETCGHAGLYFDRPAWREVKRWLQPLLRETSANQK